jgi:hypothetical protein
MIKVTIYFNSLCQKTTLKLDESLKKSFLTGEIAIEVTGVGGVSPALWYFRYMLLNGLC